MIHTLSSKQMLKMRSLRGTNLKLPIMVEMQLNVFHMQLCIRLSLNSIIIY